MKIVYGEHCLTPKHGCSPEVILVFLSLQPSWGSVNSSPARVYTVVNRTDKLAHADIEYLSFWQDHIHLHQRVQVDQRARGATAYCFPDLIFIQDVVRLEQGL